LEAGSIPAASTSFSLHVEVARLGISDHMAINKPVCITAILPKSLEPLFWDCDFHSLTLESNLSFMIRRILDRGNLEAAKWLRYTIGDDTIRSWLLTANGGGLDPHKLRFWGLILDLPEAKVDTWVEAARKTHWQGRRAG
jgi:hypothetical protein